MMTSMTFLHNPPDPMPWAKQIILTAFSLIVSEVCLRILKFIYEYKYYKKHYPLGNRIQTMLNHTIFSMKSSFIVICIVNIIAMTIISFNTENLLPYWINQIQVLLPIYLVLKFCGISYNILSLAEGIREDTRLDYASGMASSYFQGYLNLILPETGGGIKDIKERMDDYESKQHVYFPIKKFFILIPDSLHSYPKIKGQNLEQVQDLETIKIGRAGVLRPYATAVYNLKTEKESWYLCVEGATPLLSFSESMKDVNTATIEMQLLKREMVIKFYKTLKKFLHDSPKTRGLCELIYYNDVTPDGDPVDVGDVLKLHIQKLIDEGKAEQTNF